MMRMAIVAMVAGCSLTQPSKPVELRYFAPAVTARADSHATSCGRLRVGGVHAGAGLGYAIEHRLSEVELQPYETLRWSELPETYVRRAISSALFSSARFEEAIAEAPVLAIEVVAFEDATHGGVREGRVVLGYTLRDTTHVLARGEASSVHPAASDSIDAAVIAIGRSLDATGEQVARELQPILCGGQLAR